ncbi:phosphoribosylpyrophosphate synthetase [Flavobacteriaceae bacterium 14752]|uniref:phosphoribosylpyrophosphate synthetase n=1 Tax=Mesohalobacter salilacus TaxID=2491711 RepID=UPI000F62C3FA|nr:phosphoribosylpyrophosphate synthetase [Flavobacteriaceae bacterium 14752]
MNNTTLSQKINELKNKGYTLDFNMESDRISENQDRTFYRPDEFNVDECHRFEGMSNPADNSILYAITTSDGKKGVLVDGYGVSGGQISNQLQQKLNR